ncbi:hypothetical protein IWW48_003980 [Coemansia sp. RSA 1200]|nr:hypothetical protein IWW48_003980 [Coemansia sp. RSA 1200]
MRILTVRKRLAVLGALFAVAVVGACCKLSRYLRVYDKLPSRSGNTNAYGRHSEAWPLAGPFSSGQNILWMRTSDHQRTLSDFAAYLKAVHSRVNGEELSTYCKGKSFGEEQVKAANTRYQHIIRGSKPGKVFIAANLHNNEQILPNMAAQLVELARVLGPQRVFISIYENASQDSTTEILQVLKRVLLSLDIPHSITTDKRERPKQQHRIEYMAELRNRAMEPLYRNETASFDKIVFVNDVFFCVPDVLELIHQADKQNAHMTCAEDFALTHGSLTFYDTWVARDMLGRAFKPRQRNIADDSGALVGQLHGRPFQVQCCWNGMAVIDARVFAGREGIRFRRSAESECSASECSLLCNDMWVRGFERLVVVPRVKVSYEIQTRDYLRMPLHAPREMPFSERQPEKKIAFRPAPETVYCHPLNGAGLRVPDGSALFVPLLG